MYKNLYDLFINLNQRLIISIVRKYAIKDNFDDLVQDSSLALIRSISKFDVNKGFKFSTYATTAIKQAVIKSLNDSYRSIRVPLHQVQKLYKGGEDVPFSKRINMMNKISASSKSNYCDMLSKDDERVKSEDSILYIWNYIDIASSILSNNEEYIIRSFLIHYDIKKQSQLNFVKMLKLKSRQLDILIKSILNKVISYVKKIGYTNININI